jgi:trimeric autotransporter adhesin
MGSSQGHDTLIAGSGNDVLTSQGNGMLVAGSGNDVLTSAGNVGGDTLVAGTGSDTLNASVGGMFLFNTGFGSAVVNGAHAVGEPGTTIEFGTGISPANLGLSATIDPAGQGVLKITDGSSSITLDGVLDSYGFVFGTGAPVDLSQFVSELPATTSSVAGGSGNDIVEGASAVALTAGSGSDTVFAAGANDSVSAGSGADVLVALGSADSIVGGSSGDLLDFLQALGTNDTLVAGASIVTMQGRAAGTTTYVVNNSSDVIQGGAVNDTVYSSVSYTNPVGTLVLTGTAALIATADGSDTLVSNSGVDTLIGNNSNNFFSNGVAVFVVNNSLDVLEPSNSSLGEDTIDSSVSLTLPSDFATLILTGTAALTGTANTDNGAELIVGNSGNDTLVAGIGTDTLISGTGAAVDSLVGGSGNDTFVVNNAADVIQDTSTTATNVLQTTVSFTLPVNINRLVLTGTGNLSGTGNSANDSLVAGSGLDTLIAGSGADTLVAGTGLSTLIGGSGNDVFIVNNVADVIQDTSTTATNSVQSSASFSLITDVNSLTLTGTSAVTGTANGATDTITSNSGVDTLVGGGGNDTFVINNSSDVIQDTSTTTANTAKSAVSYSLATNVNTLLLTGSAGIVGTANGGNDSVTGNSGTDTLVGGAGLDTLVAGSGVSTLIGGTGNTTFVVNNASDVVQDTSTMASNTLRSSVTYVLPTNVNALILTGTAALKGTANSGNDTLTSNTGVDTLVGGAGNDTFVVSNASDIVQDTSMTATNTVQSTVAFTLPTNVNALTFTGSTALHGTGNGGNDSMTANSGADTLSAGNGTDTLVSGTTGADSLVAGTGNDLFVVNFAGDIVTVGATHGADTIRSSVSYTIAANVANLVLTGTSNLTGTGFTQADQISANTGNDTLAAGTGVATLVGGSGNDTFVINSTSDVVQDTSTTATNILSSSVSYTLPTNVNRLILTGTAALVGTANSGNDTLTANTGADTLISGAGTSVDSLVGGTGADLFVVNNVSDFVNVGTTHGVDTIQSSVSYSASANVANLTLIGTGSIAGTGNSLAGTLTANSANDTLTAGSGADTLVGGTGTDLFIVNSAADIVSLATSGTSDTIQSSASYTLSANVQYLTLSGTSALTGTGNSLTDLIVGNSGADTLVGGTGIAVLEGGRTAGSDQIKALSNQAALIGGAAASTLTGGAFKDFYAAGKVSDSITTGATANVVSVNKGDGATTLQPTTSATNVLSLGAGIDTESLFFTKTGNNLILTDGVTGDSITFTNWYVGAADQDYTKLQVVEIASANYNSVGTDGLRNKALEAFNFTALVAAYNAAGSPANWALSTAMPTTQLTSTSTADYGGDLAYYFGLNGNLTGMDLSAAQSTLTNASFGTATQTIDAFSGISGGGGLHVLTAPPAQIIRPIQEPQLRDGEDIASAGLRVVSPQSGIQLRPTNETPSAGIALPSLQLQSSDGNLAAVRPTLSVATSTTFAAGVMRVIAPGNSPQVREGLAPAMSTIELPAISRAMSVNPTTDSTAATVAPGQSPRVLPVGLSENDSISSQPRISPDSEPELFRSIAARISTPARAGIAPATSSIEVPDMSQAMSAEMPSNTSPTDSTTNVVTASDLDALRAIAGGNSPQVREGVTPEMSSIEIPAIGQAMSVSTATDLTATTVASSQASLARPVALSAGDWISIQPKISLDSDSEFLRSIAPRISSPARAGIAPAVSSIEVPDMSAAMSTETPANAPTTDSTAQRVIAPGRLPQSVDFAVLANSSAPATSPQPTIVTPRIMSPVTAVSISAIDSMLSRAQTPPSVGPKLSTNWPQRLSPASIVNPVNVAWLTMHGSLDQENQAILGGAEAPSNHNEGANDALLADAPLGRIRRSPEELGLHSPQSHQRAM